MLAPVKVDGNDISDVQSSNMCSAFVISPLISVELLTLIILSQPLNIYPQYCGSFLFIFIFLSVAGITDKRGLFLGDSLASS